jgi:hypothetical protein
MKIGFDILKNIFINYGVTSLETPVADTKLIVGNRNSRNATKVLIRRRPSIVISTKTNNGIN